MTGDEYVTCANKLITRASRVHPLNNILNNPTAPWELRNLLQISESTHSYNLRKSSVNIIRPDSICTKFGYWTFKNFYAALFNNISILKLSYDINDVSNFKQLICQNLKTIYLKFITVFVKFAIVTNLNHFYL